MFIHFVYIYRKSTLGNPLGTRYC